ncbi:MAG: hypothetical protein ACPGU5_00425 [Lishizhenia sp.]
MKIPLSIFAIIATSFILRANLSLEGSYQGKNLYVQNPESADGFGFCATKVTVNGDVMPGDIGRLAFEIDFSFFNLKVGDHVFIVIFHEDECKPKILNSEVLLPRSTFIEELITVTDEGLLKWSTSNEQGKLPYFIEQFRWSKWVKVGEVDGSGLPKLSEYQFQLIPHSGENKVRVVQIDHSGQKRKGSEIVFTSSITEVQMTPKKVKKVIKFTSKGNSVSTKYEIYDAHGNIVKKGFGATVNCENLRKGIYYINYDNKNEKFIRG